MLKKTKIIFVLLLTIISVIISIFALPVRAIDISGCSISNGFYVKDKLLKFDETVRGSTCRGTIRYPYLTNEDEDIFTEINDEIREFVEIYSVCNEGDHDNYSVNYFIPESNLKDYFSVIWYTKRDGELWRIDALTFDRDQGDLAKINEIFNPLSPIMAAKLAELSEGHFTTEERWHDFLNKIVERDISIYVEGGVWKIAFNSTPKFDKLVNKTIPEYFLIGDDVANTR